MDVFHIFRVYTVVVILEEIVMIIWKAIVIDFLFVDIKNCNVVTVGGDRNYFCFLFLGVFIFMFRTFIFVIHTVSDFMYSTSMMSLKGLRTTAMLTLKHIGDVGNTGGKSIVQYMIKKIVKYVMTV